MIARGGGVLPVAVELVMQVRNLPTLFPLALALAGCVAGAPTGATTGGGTPNGGASAGSGNGGSNAGGSAGSSGMGTEPPLGAPATVSATPECQGDELPGPRRLRLLTRAEYAATRHRPAVAAPAAAGGQPAGRIGGGRLQQPRHRPGGHQPPPGRVPGDRRAPGDPGPGPEQGPAGHLRRRARLRSHVHQQLRPPGVPPPAERGRGAALLAAVRALHHQQLVRHRRGTGDAGDAGLAALHVPIRGG